MARRRQSRPGDKSFPALEVFKRTEADRGEDGLAFLATVPASGKKGLPGLLRGAAAERKPWGAPTALGGSFGFFTQRRGEGRARLRARTGHRAGKRRLWGLHPGPLTPGPTGCLPSHPAPVLGKLWCRLKGIPGPQESPSVTERVPRESPPARPATRPEIHHGSPSSHPGLGL